MAEDPEEDGIQDILKGLPANSQSSCLALEKKTYSSWASSHPPASTWSPIISPPCCDTYCNIQASAAQLYYWPTTSPVPNVTTLVDTSGFT